jgi:hypothetical protein
MRRRRGGWVAPVAAAVLGGLGAPLLHRYGTRISNWIAGRPNDHGEGKRRCKGGRRRHRGGSMIMRGPAMGNRKIGMTLRKRIGYKRGGGYLSGPLA